MDPLSALGLAANILQFIDFTSKLFAAGYSLHKAGSTQLELDLGQVVGDLGDVAHSLTLSLRPVAQGVLSPDDQALRGLAVACLALNEELALQLKGLQVDTTRKSKWHTFRQVLKAFWEEEKILATYKRLEGLRDELILRLSVITKRTTDIMAVTQEDAFRKLDQQTAIIIQRLIEAPAELIASLREQTIVLTRRYDESDALAIYLQQETLSAIDRLKAASPMPYTQATMSSPGLQQQPLSSERVNEVLIDWLNFRQLADREDDIAVAHGNTFRWILDERKQSHGTFSPILPWLESGDGAYWISGKAGSGKSTLMKFLRSSPNFTEALNHWAHPQELVVATFYFWRSGTVLQRSQEGLLRGLLFTILSQRPDLVHTCFPHDFDNLKDGIMAITDMSPSLALMIKAFNRLSQSNLEPSKIALLIDGVDEFDGDHSDISNFFRNLASNSSFKIILSSRAIPACVEAFKGLPSLRLQDLTARDIQAYVSATVGKHERMDTLLSENPQEASNLIDMILSRASGVFLWVRLVVTSLLDGFRNYDRVSDLQLRVDECPKELGELYLHMFRNMEPRYQAHSARLLRIVVQSIEVQQEMPLTVLQLSFADEYSFTKALRAPIGPMKEHERIARIKATSGRLRSRCCGLIEVHGDVVEVIHKSVLDFLTASHVWSIITSMTPDFDPNAALMAASLLTIKASRRGQVEPLSVRHYLQYCQLKERSVFATDLQAVEELKRVMDVHHDSSSSFNTLNHACRAGLSHYLDYHLQQRNLDTADRWTVSSVLPAMARDILDRSWGRNSTSAFPTLIDEHGHISVALIDYMAQTREPQDSLVRSLLSIVIALRRTGDLPPKASQTDLDGYKVLLTMIEGLFFHLGLVDDQTNDLPCNAVFDHDQRFTLIFGYFADHVFDVLFTLLHNVASLVVDEFKENPELGARVQELTEVITHRIGAVERNQLARLGFSASKLRSKQSTRKKPRDSSSAVAEPTLSLCTPAALIGGTDMEAWNRIMETDPDVSRSLALPDRIPVMSALPVDDSYKSIPIPLHIRLDRMHRPERPHSWGAWLERNYCSDPMEDELSYIDIKGLHELHVPQPGTMTSRALASAPGKPTRLLRRGLEKLRSQFA